MQVFILFVIKTKLDLKKDIQTNALSLKLEIHILVKLSCQVSKFIFCIKQAQPRNLL